MPAYSGFWGENYSTPTTYYGDRSAKRFITPAGWTMFNTLIGAAPGAVASRTHTRVMNTRENAGLRPMLTHTDLNKTTDAGDVAALKSLVVVTSVGQGFYPADKSGNGGKAY